MIYKKVDEKENLTKIEKFGYEAEQQLAFYLNRSFKDNDSIHVINDLRLKMDDEVAQIDHLIIHKYGFIIVESKSSTSTICINEYGEWSRQYNTYETGIPSPINQAKRQIDFLQKYLEKESSLLFKKKVIFESSFYSFKFDILIAISDNGIINRADGLNISGIYKADQITEEIKAIYDSYDSPNTNVFSLKANYNFLQQTQEKIINYLVSSHEKKEIIHDVLVDKTESKNKQMESNNHELIEQIDDKKCGKCQSKQLEIRYSKYGYYFKCLDCEGNSAIKLSCKSSECNPRLRKDKLNFFKECKVCDSSVLYFENKVAAKAE